MRGCSMLLALGVVACGPPATHCDPLFSGAGGGGQQALGPIGTSGKAIEVTLSLPRFSSCQGADEVFTEVLDPANRKVEHTHSMVKIDAQFSTTFAFTPTMPGSYHLSARFEPTIGSAQTDIQVAVNRAGAASRSLTLGVNGSCSALEVTASGLTLCLNDKTSKLLVFRDDVWLQTIDADDFASAGSVVWTTRLGVVSRRLEVASATAPLTAGLTIDARCPPFTSPCPVSGEVGTLIARENEALLVTWQQTVKLRLQGSMLLEDAFGYLGTGQGGAGGGTSGGERGGGGAAHASDSLDAILIVTGQRINTGAQAKICSMSLPSATMMPACHSSGRSDVLGADLTGIWSRDDVGLRHDAFGADAGILAASMVLPGVPAPTSIPRHYEGAPSFVVGAQGFVPRFGPEGVSLEAYDIPAGFTLMPSSTKTVRVQHPDGRQILFTR